MNSIPDDSHRLQQIQQQFAARAPVYEEKATWITDAGLLGKMVEMARVGPEATLLDVCCGTGLVGAGFKGRVRRRVGLDLTAEMMEQARDRLDEWVQGSADHMPFVDGAFDITVCRQALHFVESPGGVAREMFRVLRPGGQAIIAHRVPYGPEDAAWWEQVNRKKQPLLKNILLPDDLRGIVAGAGFVDLEEQEVLVWESIRVWMDSPEASAASEEVFALYRAVPTEVAKIRGIEVTPDEIRDCWRWFVISGRKP